MGKWSIVLVLLLAGCASPLAAEPTPTPAPTPTVAPTPTPTLAQIADVLKAQLIADQIAVRTIAADAGALPTLTIVYDVNATSAADIGAALEKTIYTVSKRVAAQVEGGAAIDRVVLTLMVGETQVGSTRIAARDMVAWSKGELTDPQFQLRWSQTIN